jgi:uncharacterized protein YrrD
MNDYILSFGTEVHCLDDKCGKLAKIAFDPDTWQVSDLIVEEGFLLKRARVFPVSVLQSATPDAVHISVHGDELTAYPEYRETVVETIPEGGVGQPIMQGTPYGLATSAPPVPLIREKIRAGVADTLTVVDNDTLLQAVDETIGKVSGFLVAPENGLITYVMILKGLVFMDEFLVPTTIVERISSKEILVNLTKVEMQEFIEQDTDDYSWERMPTSEELEPAALQTTEDVRPAENGWATNDNTALAALIAESLMNDPRTEDAVIEVIHERGIVTLQGHVKDAKTRKAAEEITTQYPGVISVTNSLKVDAEY